MGFQLIMLLPFILFQILYFAYKRYKRVTGGNRNEKFRTEVESSKRNITYVSRVYEAPTQFHLQLVRENPLTHLLKAVGLAKELQTGDTAFDDYFYIVSDDPKTCEHIAGNPQLLAHLSDAVDTMIGLDFKFVGVISDGNHFSIRFKQIQKVKTEAFEEYAFNRTLDKCLLPVIDTLKDPMIVSDPEPYAKTADLVRKSTLLLSSLATALGFYMFFLVREPEKWYFDGIALYVIAALWASGITLLYIAAVLILFAGQSRIYSLLAKPVAAVFLTLFLGVYLVLRFSNVYMDPSKPRYALCTLKAKNHYRHRKAPDRYTLTMTHPLYRDELLKIDVPHSFYDTVRIDDELELGFHHGFWGYEWVDSLSKTVTHTQYVERSLRPESILEFYRR